MELFAYTNLCQLTARALPPKLTVLEGFRPQTSDAVGLKLRPTGSREVLVNVFESGSKNPF